MEEVNLNEVNLEENNIELLTIEKMEEPLQLQNILAKENNFVTDDYECAICLDSLDSLEGNKIIQLNNCNHKFHESCLKQWVLHNNTCPLCRTNINCLFEAKISLLCGNLFKKKIIVEIKEDKIIFYSYPNKTNELFSLDYFKIKKIKIIIKYCKIYYTCINGSDITLRKKNIYFDNYNISYNFFKLLANMIIKYYKKYNLTFNFV
jgi:hypothetical protein